MLLITSWKHKIMTKLTVLCIALSSSDIEKYLTFQYSQWIIWHPQYWRVKYHKIIRLFLQLLAGFDWEVKFWDSLSCDSSSDDEMRTSLPSLPPCDVKTRQMSDCWPQGTRCLTINYLCLPEFWALRGGPARPPTVIVGLLLWRSAPGLGFRQTLTQLYF